MFLNAKADLFLSSLIFINTISPFFSYLIFLPDNLEFSTITLEEYKIFWIFCISNLFI
jgi:hypothetical protein